MQFVSAQNTSTYLSYYHTKFELNIFKIDKAISMYFFEPVISQRVILHRLLKDWTEAMKQKHE